MKKKQHRTEEVIRILRQAEENQTAEDLCRGHSISKATFYRWKRKYGDMDLAAAKRLKDIEKENGELKKMLAEFMLCIGIIKCVLVRWVKPIGPRLGLFSAKHALRRCLF